MSLFFSNKMLLILNGISTMLLKPFLGVFYMWPANTIWINACPSAFGCIDVTPSFINAHFHNTSYQETFHFKYTYVDVELFRTASM